jgi:hypothetical protein
MARPAPAPIVSAPTVSTLDKALAIVAAVAGLAAVAGTVIVFLELQKALPQ